MDSLIRDQIRGSSDGTQQNNNNKPVDCKISEWKRQTCNATCGEGYRIKTRQILIQPGNGGRRCPSKMKKMERCYVKCNSNDNSNADSEYTNQNNNCKYSTWSSWSPCSKSCGEGAVQQRTRRLLVAEVNQSCTDRLQERPCDKILPCMVG